MMEETVRQFIAEHVLPLEKKFLSRPFRDLLPELQQLRAQVKALGMFTPFLSKKHGGIGLTLSEFAVLSEQMGRSPMGHYVFNCQAPDVGNIEVLARHGTEEQQRVWLHPLVNGDICSCFAMSEPEFAVSKP